MKWIKFCDEQPETNDKIRVLAWARDWYAPKIMWFCVDRSLDNDEWVCFWHNEGSCYEPAGYPLISGDGDILPTYWMPIPEPPDNEL